MRSSVSSPLLGLLGLAGLSVLALALLHGQLTLVEAATRAVILSLSLAVVERFLLPLCRSLVGRAGPDDPPA